MLQSILVVLLLGYLIFRCAGGNVYYTGWGELQHRRMVLKALLLLLCPKLVFVTQAVTTPTCCFLPSGYLTCGGSYQSGCLLATTRAVAAVTRPAKWCAFANSYPPRPPQAAQQ